MINTLFFKEEKEIDFTIGEFFLGCHNYLKMCFLENQCFGILIGVLIKELVSLQE